jgi:uncharacterized membrane protein YbhN (UPF0104 family)
MRKLVGSMVRRFPRLAFSLLVAIEVLTVSFAFSTIVRFGFVIANTFVGQETESVAVGIGVLGFGLVLGLAKALSTDETSWARRVFERSRHLKS